MSLLLRKISQSSLRNVKDQLFRTQSSLGVRHEGTYDTEEALPNTLEKTINQVTLLGRVGANPQKRGTEEHPVVIFSLATHINYKPNGEKGTLAQKTEWHRICVFKPGLRDTVYNYIQKGQRVHITGKLTYGELVDSQGQSRPTASVVADDVIFFRT
uniref:Single-stranded DNA-binding protein, mitochondrial n=1 Tax=Cacopsylla melanoneura TaxID=428564 RepID=A0A8D8YKP8_9HEMI